MTDLPDPIAPWHRRSWDEFLGTALPELLAERLPLAGYDADLTREGPTCTVRVYLAADDGDVENAYEVPRPDADGVFHVDDQLLVVPPVATTVDLADAEVLCCGERALAWVGEHLRAATGDERPTDAAEARARLPLYDWLVEFVCTAPNHVLQRNNWLDTNTHLRRIVIPDRRKVMTDGHRGRVCLVETPEGPNIGRILTVARGAEIRDRRLVVVDDSPTGSLGLTAGCIPFLEHDDNNRALMGANMMRQWLPPAVPEPALIRTGLEPDAHDFWCGHDLLTAFITWDADCYEDAVVVSESAARRMACPEPLSIGDKLSHRHGAKGVVSRVLPDADMPALPDGTPVELIFSLSSLPSRLSLGALREAALSHAVRARGDRVAVVPPFAAPDDDALRRQLTGAGLAADGMEQLSLAGAPLEHRSTVGWVYWGCTNHLARTKIHCATRVGQVPSAVLHPGDPVWFRPQTQGELEAMALIAAGAPETVREQYNTRAAGRGDADTLTERLAVGPIDPAPAPTPQLARLQAHLAATGIELALDDDSLACALAEPSGARLELAEATAHPWLADHRLRAVGRIDEARAWPALEEANQRLTRALASGAPAGLVERARAQLAARLAEYCDELVHPEGLQYHARVIYSGRSVIAPGGELDHDQVGVPEEIAWALFAPLAARRLGSLRAVTSRSAEAAAALDEAMARHWILLFRPPALEPSSFLAFRAVRVAGDAIRVHPLATGWMNADFDGDQAALFLPVTEAGQREAADRLSLRAHFARDPSFVSGTTTSAPPGHRGWLQNDAMWGLAHLARTAAGRERIDAVAGVAVCTGDTVLTSRAITAALGCGTDAVTAHERLMRLGFEVARQAGGSLGPFIGSGLDLPPRPAADDEDALIAFSGEVKDVIAAFDDLDDDELGPVVLGHRSGSRANLHQLSVLAGANVGWFSSPWSQREGQPPEMFFRKAFGAWEGLFRMHGEAATWTATGPARGQRTVNAAGAAGADVHTKLQQLTGGPGFLSRARSARRPGVVLARAAARGDRDRLVDPVSRLWVGLAPEVDVS